MTETVVDGMTFNLRHLGMTLVDQAKGEDLSAAAVKRIVATVSCDVIQVGGIGTSKHRKFLNS